MSLPQRKESIASDNSNQSFKSDPFAEIIQDVQTGLTSVPKMLNPKYFYDEKGSQLFDKITRLPEYYLTRTETSILKNEIEGILNRYKPEAVFEMGSGSATKTRLILDPMNVSGMLRGIGLFDFNEEFLTESSRSFRGLYPESQVVSIVGDFTKELMLGDFDFTPTLYLFLGSTIGNMSYGESKMFLERVVEIMKREDIFMLGIDLVKDVNIIHSAYNDSEGVTEEFNRNILNVINVRLDADFEPNLFTHEAVYNLEKNRIEMYLKSNVDQVVNLKKIDLKLKLISGESICTEISRKYTREKVESLMSSAGMEMIEWLTDADSFFAIALAKKSS
ncbi:MAG: L-histidine N(alpha)-methyltransferase [Candidatus Marinimicrobia bacterium]|nr:L-histidine N(alpha)-methyltransferase [Candidatus Neomarinimicrobiota bacterium]